MTDYPEDEEVVVTNTLKVSKLDKETKEVLHGSEIVIYKYHKTPFEEIQYQTVEEDGTYSAEIDIDMFEPAELYIPGDEGSVEEIARFTIDDDVDIYDVPLVNGKYVVVEEIPPVGYYLDSEPAVRVEFYIFQQEDL